VIFVCIFIQAKPSFLGLMTEVVIPFLRYISVSSAIVSVLVISLYWNLYH